MSNSFTMLTSGKMMTASEVLDSIRLCKYEDWEQNIAQWMLTDTNFPEEESYKKDKQK